MNIKIISDGTPQGTKIISDTGEMIENIVDIKWQIGFGNLAKAKITFIKVPIEVSAKKVKKEYSK